MQCAKEHRGRARKPGKGDWEAFRKDYIYAKSSIFRETGREAAVVVQEKYDKSLEKDAKR